MAAVRRVFEVQPDRFPLWCQAKGGTQQHLPGRAGWPTAWFPQRLDVEAVRVLDTQRRHKRASIRPALRVVHAINLAPGAGVRDTVGDLAVASLLLPRVVGHRESHIPSKVVVAAAHICVATVPEGVGARNPVGLVPILVNESMWAIRRLSGFRPPRQRHELQHKHPGCRLPECPHGYWNYWNRFPGQRQPVRTPRQRSRTSQSISPMGWLRDSTAAAASPCARSFTGLTGILDKDCPGVGPLFGIGVVGDDDDLGTSSNARPPMSVRSCSFASCRQERLASQVPARPRCLPPLPSSRGAHSAPVVTSRA